MTQPLVSDQLAAYLSALIDEFATIPAERKIQLEKLSAYLRKKNTSGSPISLNVICTHNSRRSHLGQAWLWAGAHYLGWDTLRTFSGGTEATALHPNAAAALARAGFLLEQPNDGPNPRYQLRNREEGAALTLYSKVFNDEANPKDHFAAIMVCTDADEACPFVPGAEARYSLPFEDPKRFDNTDQVEAGYDEACRLIARDFFYALHQAAQE